MVKLSDVIESNGRIASELPPGLVAVFPGGTSGIGEYSVLALAKHARQPKIYLVGRSQSAADRIIAECKRLNPEGQYFFIATDASLIKNVDDVCRQFREKEKAINLLFLSIGSLNMKPETSEGLNRAFALGFYARMRFIGNLLPQLQAAQGLRRVVTVLAANREGDVDLNDIGCRRPLSIAVRNQFMSMTTLTLEEMARRAPQVSFIHGFPGLVRSGIARDVSGFFGVLLNLSMGVLAPLICIPDAESGERHVFLATSDMYPPRDGSKADGVRWGVARGTDGVAGSGVYSISEKNDNGPRSVDDMLARLRKDGVREKVWEFLMGEFERITGTPGMLA